MAAKPTVFTPRVLGEIWKSIAGYKLFMNNPDAASVEAFLAHYAVPNPNPVFSWDDKATSVTYLYDLSINQVQATPTLEPYSGWVNALNKRLWDVLPPDLLDTNGNWKKAWLVALSRLDIASMQFIIEQGFDVNTPDKQGRTALVYAAGFFGGYLDMIRILVESGADLTLPGNTVNELIEIARQSVSSAGEVSEALAVAHYLQQVTGTK